MNRARCVVRQVRLAGCAIWRNGPVVLLPVLFFAASIAFWRPLLAESAQAAANQIDYEDAALCARFGFAAGTTAHDACKRDLLELRHGHEQLLAGAARP